MSTNNFQFLLKNKMIASTLFLIIISVAIFTGCKEKKTDDHDHAPGTHIEADEHKHSVGDGHDHSKHEKETKHVEGDGHVHGSEHTETNKR